MLSQLKRKKQQHVSAAEHHIGTLGAALVVGRRRKLARLDKRTDDTTLEQNGEGRTTRPLRERRSQQGCSDSREDNLSVTQLTCAQDRKYLGRRIVMPLSHCKCSGPSG